MAQHNEREHFSKLFHKISFWYKIFAVLFVIDLIFTLLVIHGMFIHPVIPVATILVELVAVFGVYVIFVLAIVHIITLTMYLLLLKPQDWRLAAALVTIVFSIFLLNKYDLYGMIQGHVEKSSIAIESTISKQTALRLLQECRVNDLVITQKYGAKLTFYTIPPDSPTVKTVYLEEKDIADFHTAVKEKGDECGETIKIFNDGTIKGVN